MRVRAAIVLFALAVTGCATPAPTPPAELSAASLGDEVLAFGRIRWFENGEERTRDIDPHYLHVQDMRTGALEVDEAGGFTWKLPRGAYVLHQLYWRDPWSGPQRLTPKVAFELPQDFSLYCLGTLVIDVAANRYFLGALWVEDVKIHVEDECVELTSGMQAKYTDPSLTFAKSLMVFDPRMPPRPVDLEQRDQLRDFLRSILPGLMTIH